MKIAIFDYLVTETNPAGSCSRRLVEGLCENHEITVFSVQFANPRPDKIEYIHVPAIRRPLALLFISFHCLAPIIYRLHVFMVKSQFNVYQFIESNLSFGDISYCHFCHRAFLKSHWKNSGATGFRGFLRWLDHKLHAIAEPSVFRRAKHIVVPSHGLAKELSAEYPFASAKIHVISNAVDVDRLQHLAEFDRSAFRSEIGLRADDIVLVFVALGQFERKGLPLILKALPQFAAQHVKVLVVGGTRDLVASYRERAAASNVTDAVIFVGNQLDVRPYLWAADAFILPSSYEVFPLVALEAAAASLPLIVTKLYGTEEFLVDQKNGLLIERTVEGIADGIMRFLSMPREKQKMLGVSALRSVQPYNHKAFVTAWKELYDRVVVAC